MSISHVVTRGFGNGTLVGTIAFVTLRGYTVLPGTVFIQGAIADALFTARITAAALFQAKVTGNAVLRGRVTGTAKGPHKTSLP